MPTKEHYSGQRRPASILQGNIDVTVKFETGWITDKKEDASYWEYLLVKYLIIPSDQGSVVPFDLEHHDREYNQLDGTVTGGKIIAAFRECTLSKHSGAVSQGSPFKRSYEADCRIVAWGEGGTLHEETGGQ